MFKGIHPFEGCYVSKCVRLVWRTLRPTKATEQGKRELSGQLVCNPPTNAAPEPLSHSHSMPTSRARAGGSSSMLGHLGAAAGCWLRSSCGELQLQLLCWLGFVIH